MPRTHEGEGPSLRERLRVSSARHKAGIQNAELSAGRAVPEFEQALHDLRILGVRVRLCGRELPEPLLRLAELGRIGEEAEAAGVPADRILGSQPEGRSYLAFAD